MDHLCHCDMYPRAARHELRGMEELRDAFAYTCRDAADKKLEQFKSEYVNGDACTCAHSRRLTVYVSWPCMRCHQVEGEGWRAQQDETVR